MEHRLDTLAQCPSCGNDVLTLSHESTDHTVSKEAFTVVECSQCHLLMTNPRPVLEELGTYYKSDDYISHTESRKGLINSVYHIVRMRTLKTKVSLVRALNDSKSVLDYGAGTGRFLDACQSAGMTIRGAEPDEDAVANAPASVKMAIGEPEAVLMEGERYDTITLWHVLEHVPELKRVLSRLKQKLQPNGRLIVAVPNHTSFDAEHYGKEWAAWDVPRHLWHFSPVSMDRLMRSVGFEVLDTKPMWYDSVYVSLLSEKIKGSGFLGVVRGGLLGLWSNFRHLTSSEPRCSSIIYVMKHSEAV